jgi:hypothetical protein
VQDDDGDHRAEGLLHQFGFGILDTIAKPERAEEI